MTYFFKQAPQAAVLPLFYRWFKILVHRWIKPVLRSEAHYLTVFGNTLQYTKNVLNLISILDHSVVSWTCNVYMYMSSFFDVDQISFTSDRHWIPYKYDFELLISLTPSLKSWGYRYDPPYVVDAVLCIRLRASCVLGKHSTHWAPFTSLGIYFQFSVCNLWLNSWVMVISAHESLSESFILDFIQWLLSLSRPFLLSFRY